LIAAAGLVVRVVYALAVVGKAPLVGDGLEFDGLAGALADGRGYVTPFVAPGHAAVATAHKPPLYPMALALVSVFGGRSYVAHQVASGVIGAAAVVVIAVLAYRIAGRRAALLAALIGAAYPVFVAMDASLRSETLYVLLIALALLAAHYAWERPTPLRLALLGAAIALAALTRSEGLALLVLLALPAIWRSGAPRRGWRFALVCAACALVLAPWLIRCWIVFDQPVLISTNYGDLIAGSNCSGPYFGPHPGGWAFDCILGGGAGNEAQVADRLRARGLRYARDHASRLPAVIVDRTLRPWGLYDAGWEVKLRATGEGGNATIDWIGLAACWALMLLAVVGFVVLRRRRQPLFILIAPFVLVVLVSITSYGVLRFRAPADVALVILAAVALDALWPRKGSPHPRLRRA
jgi:hypothetical protein